VYQVGINKGIIQYNIKVVYKNIKLTSNHSLKFIG